MKKIIFYAIFLLILLPLSHAEIKSGTVYELWTHQCLSFRNYEKRKEIEALLNIEHE